MMEAGIPVGAGTDATRVASYNPWVSLSWLVTGRTVGGLALYPVRNRLDRETALRLWTQANTWFSNEQGKKGQIVAGQLADLALLSDDFFTVPDNEIVNIRSVLTILGGKVVHGNGSYAKLRPTCRGPCPTGRRWAPSVPGPRPKPSRSSPRPVAVPPPAASMAMTMLRLLARRPPPPIPRASGAPLAAAAGPSDTQPVLCSTRKSP
jgi:hypothetical protein